MEQKLNLAEAGRRIRMSDRTFCWGGCCGYSANLDRRLCRSPEILHWMLADGSIQLLRV
jgi:hypothetical protein